MSHWIFYILSWSSSQFEKYIYSNAKALNIDIGNKRSLFFMPCVLYIWGKKKKKNVEYQIPLIKDHLTWVPHRGSQMHIYRYSRCINVYAVEPRLVDGKKCWWSSFWNLTLTRARRNHKLRGLRTGIISQQSAWSDRIPKWQGR